MTAIPVDSEYWCAGDSEEFAKSYFARLGTQSQGGSYGYLSRLQLLAHRHFYGSLPSGYVGDMPSAAEVTRAGDQGSNVELRVNWLRSHANAKHQIIVAPKLAWSCQAINTDSRSMADASRGSDILESMWKQGNFEAQAISCVLGSILYGEEFLFTYWSSVAGEQLAYDPESKQYAYEGDITCRNVLPWNIFRDPTANTFDESPWLSARISLDRHELIAEYPEFKDEILAAASPPPSTLVNASGVSIAVSDPNKVLCHYFFHKRTPALPTGLHAVLLNENCVLQFEPLERCYWDLPIHRMSAGDLKATPWSYTDFWEAMALQDLATDIQGSLATNIVTFGKQMISAESDQNLPIDQIGNGPLVVYRPKGSPVPVPLQLSASPPEAFKHLDMLKQDQRQILGLNDVSMGEAPTGAPNAQAWALLSTAAITANSGGQRSWVSLVRNVGRSMLNIFKEKVSTKRKIAIIGVHGAAVPKQEEWDKSDFEGIDDVTVEISNPLSQTPAGRLQLAQMYMDRGFVQTPEQLQSVTEIGSLKPMTQVLRDEMIFIAGENEQILKGVNPPVMITDSHQIHIREHKGPTFNADARSIPEAMTAQAAHTKAHIDLLMNTDPRILSILGQAQPPPPAPPPMGGPPGPGGPPPGGQGPKPEDIKAAMQSPLNGQNGAAGHIKQPTAPVDPATGAQSAPPGMPQ